MFSDKMSSKNSMRFPVKFCIIYFSLSASSWLCDAISVNMQGSFTLGKEVMDMLSQYIGTDFFVIKGLNGLKSRRSMPPSVDYYTGTTVEAQLCENLQFCMNLKDIVEEYITMLGKAVESIFDVVTNGIITENKTSTIFGAEFAKVLTEIKPVLKLADTKINDENEQQIWTGTIKRISSRIQSRVHAFTNHNLVGKTEDIVSVRKKLDQKLLLAIIAVEDTYLRKLCSIHNICLKSVEATRALNIVLENFKKLDENMTKHFISEFEFQLEETDFYSNMKEETATAFQIVLHDMGTSELVTSKDVLVSVQKSVETRLKLESTAQSITGGFDTKLVNTILSDMDYIYTKHKPDPFHAFMSSFYDWQAGKSNIKPALKAVIKRLQNDLRAIHPDIQNKLSNEVRIFLEITVDP